jgi:hypothetical protein
MEGHIPAPPGFQENFLTLVQILKQAGDDITIRFKESVHRSLFERSPIPNMHQILMEMRSGISEHDMGKMCQRVFVERLICLYQRIDELISEVVSLRDIAGRKMSQEDLTTHAAKVIGKIQDAFMRVAIEIEDFGKAKKKLVSESEERMREYHSLKNRFTSSIKRVGEIGSELKQYLMYADYVLPPDGDLSDEQVNLARQKLAELRGKMEKYNSELTILRSVVPEGNEHDICQMKILSPEARNLLEQGNDLRRRLEFWERVFSEAKIEHDPYFTFGVKKEDVMSALSLDGLNKIVATPLLSMSVDEVRLAKMLDDAQKASQMIERRVASVLFEQDQSFTAQERAIQKLIIVVMYGITKLSQRSKGRTWNTFQKVLRSMGFLKSSEEELFEGVFLASSAPPTPLVYRNTAHFDRRREYFLLTDIGSRQAERFRTELGKTLQKTPNTDLAVRALEVMREMDRESSQRRKIFFESHPNLRKKGK